MNTGDIGKNYSYTIKQAVGVAGLRKALDQDVIAVDAILKGMEETSSKVMENSVTPFKGSNIDVSV